MPEKENNKTKSADWQASLIAVAALATLSIVLIATTCRDNGRCVLDLHFDRAGMLLEIDKRTEHP